MNSPIPVMRSDSEGGFTVVVHGGSALNLHASLVDIANAIAAALVLPRGVRPPGPPIAVDYGRAPHDPLLTQAEVAQRLRRSVKHVARLRKAGRLESIPGRPVLIRTSAVESFIADLEGERQADMEAVGPEALRLRRFEHRLRGVFARRRREQQR